MTVKDSYIYRILVSVCGTYWSLNLDTPNEEELAVDYRRNNQNLDMLLLIMGLLCNISMWGVMGFSFRDLWNKELSLSWHVPTLDVPCFLNCYDNAVGSFEKFLVIAWKWVHWKWIWNVQQEQRLNVLVFFLLRCCSCGCLAPSAKKKENNGKLTVSV